MSWQRGFQVAQRGLVGRGGYSPLTADPFRAPTTSPTACRQRCATHCSAGRVGGTEARSRSRFEEDYIRVNSARNVSTLCSPIRNTGAMATAKCILARLDFNFRSSNLLKRRFMGTRGKIGGEKSTVQRVRACLGARLFRSIEISSVNFFPSRDVERNREIICQSSDEIYSVCT